MTKERISGGLGVIIDDPDIMEHILNELNKHSSYELSSLYDIDDVCCNIDGIYLDDTHTIELYLGTNPFYSGSKGYDRGLVIWARKGICINKAAYETKAEMIEELKNKLKNLLPHDNNFDFESNSGLILYTEYN